MSFVTKVHFHKLKRLVDVTVEFPEKGIVALMGENGTGKTTALHALACIYKPHEHLQRRRGDLGNWWTDWFVPHTGNFWNDSRIRVYFNDNQNGVVYRKGDRWSPRKQERRERYCRYVGFKDSIPHIEEERLRSRFEFALHPLDLSEAKRTQFLICARTVLNRNYTDIQRATKRTGLRDFLYASVAQGNPPVHSNYTSHYMGAGEQKVLKIIEEIISAPDGALLLFEEFEVAVHESAIRRLIPWMVKESENRSLQIVVSTHWPRMIEFSESVHLRTLHSDSSGNIVCLNGCKPSVMYEMTGDLANLRLITVWVEDQLAARIVERIATSLGIVQNVTIKIYGAINNAFSIAATLELDNANYHVNLVVIDGDRYRRRDEKLGRLRTSLSGTGEKVIDAQVDALRWIAQFNPVTEDCASPLLPTKPERFLLEAAMRVRKAGNASQYIEQFFDYVAGNVFENADKSMVYNMHKHFNLPIDRVEYLLIDAAEQDESWSLFVWHISERLAEMARGLQIAN